jgi:glycosyltransferase involved in cell wall biosynthesis
MSSDKVSNLIPSVTTATDGIAIAKRHTILAISDFGTSGISESARLPLYHFHEQGHIIWHLALGFNGIVATVDRSLYPWADRLLPIFPRSEETKFGQLQIRQALEIAKPSIILSTFDIWMTEYLVHPEKSNSLDDATKEILSHQKRKFHHILYFPIDGLQEGKYLPVGMDDSVLGADSPITYSKFSRDAIKFNTNIDVPFIPIPHNPAIYRPLDKKECRRKMHLNEDAFIVGMIGTNQYRKSWGHFMDGVVPLAQKHKDVLILPYTNWSQMLMGGADIKSLIYRSGLEDRVIDPSGLCGKLDDEGMAILYNCLDVCVLATVGEGCGLPPLRARACGIPALVTANTSNTEFFGHPFEGIKVKAKYFDNFGSNLERYITDSDDLREKLEILYNNPEFRNEVGQAGLTHMKQFEVDKVMPLWDDVLAKIPVRTDEVAQ